MNMRKQRTRRPGQSERVRDRFRRCRRSSTGICHLPPQTVVSNDRHLTRTLAPPNAFLMETGVAVKRAMSKYNAKGTNVSRATYKATIGISILSAPTLTASPCP
jgi:hypothetical protein